MQRGQKHDNTKLRKNIYSHYKNGGKKVKIEKLIWNLI